MYWFRRPPYLRWAAAALLVVAAAWMDLRPDSSEPRPFAAVDLPAGSVVGPDDVVWRPAPVGLLPELTDPAGVTVRNVSKGEPLVPSALTADRVEPPDGWWTMEADLPRGAAPGQAVHLVVLPTNPDGTPTSVPGVVVEPAPVSEDPFAIEDPLGLVAVPGESAAFTAAAIADGRVTAILGD